MNISTGQWLVGFVGTWFVLSAMADVSTTAYLASALAIAIATTATFVLGPKAAGQIFNTGA